MLHLIFTEEAIRTLHYERYHYPDPRVQVKMEVLWLKSQGIAHREIARLTGVTSRTVQRYLHEYLEGGIERLKQNKYAGTPSVLNEQATSLKSHFEKHPPHTIAEAQNIIEKLTGIRRSRPQVWKFLRRLGMKCRKIAAVPGKVDEAKQQEQERFLRINWSRDWTTRKPVVAKFFCGRRPFCPRRLSRPLVVFRADVRPIAFGSKAVECSRRFEFCHQATDHDHQYDLRYLDHGLRIVATAGRPKPGVPITLVLDNARYQHCQLVQNLAAELSIELLFLPSYSPNLNLIERLWKYVKKDCLNSKIYETFADFQSAITDCLARINSEGKRDMKSLISRNFQLFNNQTFLAS